LSEDEMWKQVSVKSVDRQGKHLVSGCISLLVSWASELGSGLGVVRVG